ncbi:MAG: HK97 family phage prohead protease [Paraclostridium sp.]
MNKLAMNGKEVRHIHINKLELRSIEGSQNKVVGGYVNQFNKQSSVMRDRWGDEFVEVISEGAFNKTLETKSQKALWNHNEDLVLGSVSSGTLNLFTDNLGLRCEITLPNTTWGNDAHESIQRGDVDGMSFGFRCVEDMWSKIQYEDREIYKRTILEVELFEVSPCVFPAYPDSQINIRSLNDFKEEIDKERRKKLILQTYL